MRLHQALIALIASYSITTVNTSPVAKSVNKAVLDPRGILTARMNAGPSFCYTPEEVVPNPDVPDLLSVVNTTGIDSHITNNVCTYFTGKSLPAGDNQGSNPASATCIETTFAGMNIVWKMKHLATGNGSGEPYGITKSRCESEFKRLKDSCNGGSGWAIYWAIGGRNIISQMYVQPPVSSELRYYFKCIDGKQVAWDSIDQKIVGIYYK
ncbi:hypothetical protein BJ508DRAFT_375786 [Ascobolus immersus RN42]|uniref:Ecp2 effector protein domain-containing protein n=1 Tax=Ascobolus immersus RN42 TaxID=1160509 RepID=A0A3N4I9Z9_ASCIM|nr:hypothetical protein BJ508DRAFT_375786 [Ascobolus immersus RN42]